MSNFTIFVWRYAIAQHHLSKKKKVLSLKVDTTSIFQGCLLQKDPSEGSLEPGLALGR